MVSRLRGSLGPAAHRLVSGPSGYRIEVAADELDVSLAQSAFAEGQRLSCANDPSRAADVLGAALARWTSEPLHDLAPFPFCHAAQNRLRELRVSIYELRNDALLEAGRHVELLETIDEWISAEPWRERLRVQHVLALYRSGRQVDALRAYDAYRDRLVEELGVEPSHELRELHRDVLSHAPGLAIGVGPLGSRIPLWTSLSLPFVGRGDEEELIFGRIREVFAGSRMMVLVEGEAGIGKTRLILEVAPRAGRRDRPLGDGERQHETGGRRARPRSWPLCRSFPTTSCSGASGAGRAIWPRSCPRCASASPISCRHSTATLPVGGSAWSARWRRA